MLIKDIYIVKAIDNYQTKEWMLKKHYAKRMPTVMQHAFGLFRKSDDMMVGCCTYGLPASDNAMKLCGEENKEITKELSRLIKNDGLEKNLQTWFVAQTFKLLPKPMIILSYSDCNNGHNGYTYQALNFMYTGKGGGASEYVYNQKTHTSRWIKKEWFLTKGLAFNDELTITDNFRNAGGEIIKQMPKNRYVIFLGSKTAKKNLRKKLKWEVLPYPKGDNSRYDTSYITTTQLGLF